MRAVCCSPVHYIYITPLTAVLLLAVYTCFPVYITNVLVSLYTHSVFHFEYYYSIVLSMQLLMFHRRRHNLVHILSPRPE